MTRSLAVVLIFGSFAVVWGCQGRDPETVFIPEGSGGSPGGSVTTGGAALGGAATGGVAAGGQGGSGLGGECQDDCPLPWAGVNLAGAEFGEEVPGVFDTDYTYPTASDIDYFSEQGMTIIRLPFRWERLQPSLGGEFSSAELERLSAVVDVATARGLRVILDPHNYARYVQDGQELILGDDALTSSHFANLWERLAGAFLAEERVIFGLMNEPHDMPTGDWVEGANAAIQAIREIGAEQWILVPGNHWTGAHSWTSTDNHTALLQVSDPLDKIAYDVHQYMNRGFSGATEECVHLDANSLVGDLTEWLRKNDKRAFLGEFGTGTGDDCRVALHSLLSHLEANADVWLGWTYWAGGPWWGDYFMSITPDATGAEKPQMGWLRPHLP